MTEPTSNFTAQQAAVLLTCYGFDLTGYSARTLIYQWLKQYQAKWIHLAVVEALYQGRYKAISVEQILSLWLRRGQPNFHFSHEFERLICDNLPQKPTQSSYSLPNALPERQFPAENFYQSSRTPIFETVAPPPLLVAEDSLPPAESASPEAEPAAGEVLSAQAETAAQEAENRPSIHEFTPLLDHSELYSKLRAVVHQTWESISEE
jgi:hypothetical protein